MCSVYSRRTFLMPWALFHKYTHTAGTGLDVVLLGYMSVCTEQKNSTFPHGIQKNTSLQHVCFLWKCIHMHMFMSYVHIFQCVHEESVVWPKALIIELSVPKWTGPAGEFSESKHQLCLSYSLSKLPLSSWEINLMQGLVSFNTCESQRW